MNFQRIHALPLHLANQIAAGEVVERPASVLKELVENSLDAGASQVDIEIAGAGSDLVRVTDNGYGIHPDDLSLALSRHATSKLHASEDLSHIGSLGFRGEALPSIASVSRLTLTSRLQNSEHAWQINSDSAELQPAAHPQGTTVSVEELFFNIPARRRFLRSDKTELHHCLTTLHRLALSRFDVGFNYYWGEQQSLRLPAITDTALRHQRIAKICGRSFINDSLYLKQQFETIELHGWIGKPSAHRAQTDVQYFFINGRVIKDRLITHAIRQAYDALLPAGRQPAYVLYLSLPLDNVDVNVHPTKHEVRFREARLIHGLITQAIQDALQTSSAATTEFELELDRPAVHSHVAETRQSYLTESNPKQPVTPSHHSSSPLLSSTASTKSFVLLHQRYALLIEETPQLIDLMQADKQHKQQQLSNAITGKNLVSRPILVPIHFELDPAKRALLATHRDLLSQFAIEISCSEHHVAVKRIPYLLSQVDIKWLIDIICNCLQQSNSAEHAIVTALLTAVPEVAIVSYQQAQLIFDTLNGSDWESQPWCRKLDSSTLSSLFST